MKGKKFLVFSLLSLFAAFVSGIDERRLPAKFEAYFSFYDHEGGRTNHLIGTLQKLQRGSRLLSDWSAKMNDSVILRNARPGFFIGSTAPYSIAVGNTLKIEIWNPPAERVSGDRMGTSPLITVHGRIPATIQILTPADGGVIALRRTPANITIGWVVAGDTATELHLRMEDITVTPPRSILSADSRLGLTGTSYTFSSALLQPGKQYQIEAQLTVRNFGTITGLATSDSTSTLIVVSRHTISTVKAL